ncbi:hypothetical protein F0562_028191 [Nyssa sinensis]|uniref:Uncharacterized protein n=1 Tax=Nyssa sinensis TaxID=561372 RepID=A0A5J5B5T3_9ASTE|nr:hypothetical protein F0562_028191 [Nyssa sinensis]
MESKNPSQWAALVLEQYWKSRWHVAAVELMVSGVAMGLHKMQREGMGSDDGIRIDAKLINQAMATEDFTFPTITDTPPRFIDSPPLWRSASATFRHEETERRGPTAEGENVSPQQTIIKYGQRKSFSCIESGVKTLTEDASEDDEEEKMDMLWEECFNEELSKKFGSGPDSDMSPGRMVEFGCVHALKLSKTGVSGKRPTVVVFMKFLKKLFLLHNSHRTLKKHSL